MVVFVAGDGGIDGALSELGGDGYQQAVGVTLSLVAAAALNAGDAQEDIAGLGVAGDEVEEALVLAGGAAVLEGVEVAAGRAGAGAGATTTCALGGRRPVAGGQKHERRPFGGGDGRRWTQAVCQRAGFVFSVGRACERAKGDVAQGVAAQVVGLGVGEEHEVDATIVEREVTAQV